MPVFERLGTAGLSFDAEAAEGFRLHGQLVAVVTAEHLDFVEFQRRIVLCEREASQHQNQHPGKRQQGPFLPGTGDVTHPAMRSATARSAITLTRWARYSADACRSELKPASGTSTALDAAGVRSRLSTSSIAVARNAQGPRP